MTHILETRARKVTGAMAETETTPKPAAPRASEAEPVTATIVRQAPPPGMGKLVDKTA